MQSKRSHALVSLLLALLSNGVVCADQAAPKVLLYHSFDGTLEKADYSAGPVVVSAFIHVVPPSTDTCFSIV